MGPADQNGLLAALPSPVYERLAPSLKPVRLDAGESLYDIGSTIDHVWFPTCGMVSLLTNTEAGDIIEVIPIGREGVIGLSGLKRRNDSLYRARVQMSGGALRIGVKTLLAVLEEERAWYEFLEYAQALSEQSVQAAVCNQFHTSEQRLMRWLLLAQDRVLSSRFHLTHEALGDVLGISRSIVSGAAGVLQRRGLISYSRGWITIQNRERLLATSCECYGIISRTVNS